MSEKKQFRAIKGVRDILPPDTALWNWFEQTTRQVLESYNFREIRLPIFEDTELFARSVGVDTDIVLKEMYSFLDKGLEIPTYAEGYAIKGLPPESPSFLQRIERALSAGEIPRTEQNKAALGEVRKGLNSIPAEVYAEMAKSGSPAFRDWCTAVFSQMHGLRLGYSLTLRPEATASVVRAYIEHGMHTWAQPVKLYYVGPMFRRERPQKGRFRQFYQIGAEVLGPSDHPAVDAEVIEMLVVLFERCRLERWTLFINSIGCKDCRPAYVARLREALLKVKAQLGPDSQRRIETNPLRVLDSKLPEEQAVIEKLPRITEHLCVACRAHFAAVEQQLKLRGIPYEVNWRLVRGLDYYMRTTFEITAPGLGAQNAICGGGRYDGLVELLGGPPTKGIGFAIGTDRLVLSLQEAGKGEAGSHLDVFVAWMSAPAFGAAMKFARRLRVEGFRVELPAEEMKLKKSLGQADKLGARYALIIGGDEVASGRFTLKRLSDAEQRKLTESELVAFLKSESQRAPQTRPERASRISS